MSYQVKDYMVKELITVISNATVTEVAKVMATDPSCGGYAVVLLEGKPEGMVTERDIVNKALANDLDPVKTKVSEIMSSPLITIDPDDDLLNASKLMREQNVRKLIVLRNDIVYGIITAKDIAQRCGDYVDRSVKDIFRWTAPLGI